jgi:hypothetical protein
MTGMFIRTDTVELLLADLKGNIHKQTIHFENMELKLVSSEQFPTGCADVQFLSAIPSDFTPGKALHMS